MTTEPTPPQHEQPRRRWQVPSSVLLAIGAVLVAALIPASIYFTAQANLANQRAHSAEAQEDAVSKAAAPVARTLKELCARDNKLAQQLRKRGACDEAENVEKVIKTPPLPPPIVDVDSEDIREQVNAYFAENPVRGGPTIEQVTRIVADIYAANPPADGQDGRDGEDGEDGEDGANATSEQIAAAVARYCADETCRGPAGRAPTEAEVSAAVAAYCGQESAPCRGPRGAQGDQGAKGEPGADGAQGPAGDAVVGHRFERVEGDCRSIMTIRRADETTYEIDADAGESACPPPRPPN